MTKPRRRHRPVVICGGVRFTFRDVSPEGVTEIAAALLRAFEACQYDRELFRAMWSKQWRATR